MTEHGGEVVGFATWFPVHETLAEVGGNAVDPEFHGHGIGSAQMQWVIDMFREKRYKCARVFTGMDPAHGSARSEYRHVGLRRGVTISTYLNYLDEVARIPVRNALNFRWAERDDVALVRQLARMAWVSVYEGVRRAVGDEIFGIAFTKAVEGKAEEFAQVAADTPEQVRIVVEDGRPAGFAVLHEDAPKKLGELKTVAVAPEFRGRGVGCGLCMDAFGIFRERGLQYARLTAGQGEVNERTRQMCWSVGLYRELPTIYYYMLL